MSNEIYKINEESVIANVVKQSMYQNKRLPRRSAPRNDESEIRFTGELKSVVANITTNAKAFVILNEVKNLIIEENRSFTPFRITNQRFVKTLNALASLNQRFAYSNFIRTSQYGILISHYSVLNTK